MNYQELTAKLAETETALAQATADLQASQALATETEAKLTDATKALSAKTTLLEEATAEIASLKAGTTERDSKIIELQGQIVSVDQAATTKLANVGEAAVARGKVNDPDINEETPAGLLERFHSLTGRERTKFFRENKEKLFAAEAALNGQK